MTCYQPSPGVAYRMIGGQMVIVQPTEDRLLTLNPTGTHIWELLDGRTDVESIVSQLCTRFEVSPATARAETEEFLEDMHRRALITAESTS